ncbi:MAG: CBS domain-containing protein [Candidatus Korarchaeota archaeon]|nr:CBS domain-containing protein [Candidatus Korarchaeota archaeon]
MPYMKVGDLLKGYGFISVTPDKTVREAAKVMANKGIGFLVVVDSSDPRKVVGVLSERDIIRALASNKEDAKVEELMTKDVVTVKDTDTLYKAAKLMREHRIRHLVVVNEDGIPVGVLSIRDLTYEEGALKALAEEIESEFSP